MTSKQFKVPPFIAPALFNDTKYTCIKAGRRTGKTYNVAIWQLVKLLSNAGTYGLWVDTVQGNLDAYVNRYFRALLGDIWQHCKYDKQKHNLYLPNGSELILRSAERPENMEGFDYHYVVLNEAGIILKSPDLWFKTLQPMCKAAQVKIVGTPKGKNTFHQLYYQDSPDWASYSFSIYDSPFYEEKEIEALKPGVPQEVWEQEYLADFVDGAGSVFRNIHKCTMPVSEYSPVPGMEYVMGVDLAKHQDFTVIYVAESKSKKVVYMDRFNQIDWGLQKKRIIAAWERFNKPQIVLDSTGVGDAIYDDLKGRGISGIQPFKFTASSKQELINNLSVSLDNQNISYMGWDVLLAELESFEYAVSTSGNFKYSAPSGLHDDCVIALALVNHGLNYSGAKPALKFVAW